MEWDGRYFSVYGHPNDFYNGDYYYRDLWNGYPHFQSLQGGHYYYLNTDSNEDGYWQFDNRE